MNCRSLLLSLCLLLPSSALASVPGQASAELTVAKDAVIYHGSNHFSCIELWGQEDFLVLPVSEATMMDYFAALAETVEEEQGWWMSGVIGISSRQDVVLYDVVDEVDGGLTAVVDCGQPFPIELAAGSGIQCVYYLAIPDPDYMLNTTCVVHSAGTTCDCSLLAGPESDKPQRETSINLGENVL